MDSTQSKLENERLEEASSEEIRRDIRGTRSQMDATIDQLGDRLHPRHLLDDVIDLFKRPGSNPGASVARTSGDAGKAVLRHVKENPVPALLVGAGLVWWMIDANTDDDPATTESPYRDLPRYPAVPTRPATSTERIERLGSFDEPSSETADFGLEDEPSGPTMADRAKAKYQDARDSLGETGDSLRQGATARWDSARDSMDRQRRTVGRKAGELQDQFGRQASELRDRVSDASDEHPLAMGGILLAAGICAGLLLPRSKAEDEWMGEAADQVKAEAAERTKEVATKTAGSALDEAEARGLTPANIAEKAGRVVSEAVAAGQSAAHEEGLSGEQLAADAKAVTQSAADTASGESKEQAKEIESEDRTV